MNKIDNFVRCTLKMFIVRKWKECQELCSIVRDRKMNIMDFRLFIQSLSCYVKLHSGKKKIKILYFLHTHKMKSLKFDTSNSKYFLMKV